MSDEERAMLDVIAERLGVPNASEAFRVLVRREHEATKPTTKPTKRSAR